jgi:hypothetical protein
VHALAVPLDIKMVFSSALLTAVSVAIVLTAVFRIGVQRRVETAWEVAQGDAVLRNWMVSNARLWGVRTELVAKADAVMEEFALAMGGCLPRSRHGGGAV